MKVTIKDLKSIIKEELLDVPKKVSIDTLSSFQERLDDMLIAGELTSQEYEKQWRDVLQSVGWSESDYENEIDRRWDYVDRTQSSNPFYAPITSRAALN